MSKSLHKGINCNFPEYTLIDSLKFPGSKMVDRMTLKQFAPGSTKTRRTSQPFITPPKFNMEPENDGLQKENPFPGTNFSGEPC